MSEIPIGGYQAYDRMNEAYTRKNVDGAFNAYFERPTMLSLLPKTKGLRVLDIGVGPGGLAHDLVERGAIVTGIDGSEAMLAAARQRLGGRAELLLRDLDDGLVGFEDATFDIVVSSLTIHYVADLKRLAKEMSRVLVPGGTLAFSTHHPVLDFPLSKSGRYFNSEVVEDTWDFGTTKFSVQFYRRPLSLVLQTFLNAGFALDAMSEGLVGEPLRERFPKEAEILSRKPFFVFLRFTKRV